MTVTDTIRRQLEAEIDCTHLEVINESHTHNVPANSETHFRVVLVSAEFEGVRRVARHRRINRTLADLLAGPVHALAIEAVTPAQWVEHGGRALCAPECGGGSRAKWVSQ